LTLAVLLRSLGPIAFGSLIRTPLVLFLELVSAVCAFMALRAHRSATECIELFKAFLEGETQDDSS